MNHKFCKEGIYVKVKVDDPLSLGSEVFSFVGVLGKMNKDLGNGQIWWVKSFKTGTAMTVHSDWMELLELERELVEF